MKVKSSSIPELSSRFFNSLQEISKENNNRNILAGFAVPAELKLPHGSTDVLLKNFERSFYFSHPEKNFRLIGLDEILSISESGDARFALTDRKVRDLKVQFMNNFDEYANVSFPVFLGGMKFTPDHSGNEWDEFSDSTWFIPEICIFSVNDNNYVIIFEIISAGTNLEKTRARISTKLELIENHTKGNQITLPSVRNVTGNSMKDKKKWKTKVAETIDEILNNQIEKVVLSRKIELTLDKEIVLSEVIRHFEENYPACYTFVFHRGKSAFFGASPELLARFSDRKVYIEALAGSAPRGSNQAEDEQISYNLLNDTKNLNEHNFVIDSIINAISSFSENVTVEAAQSIKKLQNIQHITSLISAELKNSGSMLSVLKELYPTPAICGTPKDAALSYIKKHEGFRRGLYAGIIGWFNFNAEGNFIVAIRSALAQSNKVYAYAGCGIVENSDPEHEFNESELKLIPVTSIFTNDKKNKS